MLAAVVGLEVFGVVALVCGQEVLVQWDGVGDEFDDTRRGRQREDFVGTNAEIPLAGGSLGLQEVAHLVEDLLHYGVLSKIIGATFELRYMSACALCSFSFQVDSPTVCTSDHLCQWL